MDPSSLRRRRRFQNLLALSVLILLAGGIWLRIELKWAAMGTQLDYLVQEVSARDARRPALREPAIPGNAWEDYLLCTDAYEAIRLSFPSFRLAVLRGVDRAAVDLLEKDARFQDASRAALAHLVRGARRSECRCPDDWMSGSRDVFAKTDRSDLGPIAWAAGVESRLLVAQGRPAEAMELLAAAAQASIDLGWNVPSREVDRTVWMSDELFTEIGIRLREGRPSGETLAFLDRLLAAWDAVFIERFPLGVACALIPEGRLYQQFMPLVGDPSELMEPSLRDFFSQKHLLAGAFHRSLAWRPRAEEFFRADGPDAEMEGWVSLGAEVRGTGRSLDLHRSIGELSASGDNPWGRRTAHARIRALRTAVRFLMDGTVPELRDPFGGSVRHDKTGGRLRIWTAQPRRWDGTGPPGQPLEVERFP